MNQFEEMAILSASDSHLSISGVERFMTHPGVSQLVAARIIEDIHRKIPSLDISNLSRLAELANQFAMEDGLLDTSDLDLPLSPAYERLNFEIALTTFWIAQFTRMQENSKCRSLMKKQREFQTCLLVYFFNQIIGLPPSQLRKKVENITIQEFGLYGWYFDNSQEHNLKKMKLLFDIMHMCSLEYWNPGISEL